jgi:hypothetical protein
MQVQVRINEQGALRNGRFAFTDRYTLVTELLQNARRAGATEVSIDYDEAQAALTVCDDGCGIDDFQKLLTLHESGWHAGIVEEENAFGVGFSKCLYAAKNVSIASKGRRLEFDTELALQREVLEVLTDADTAPGRTTVRLGGVVLPHLEVELARLVRGFPVPVRFNGVLLPRPHSVGAMRFHETDIGLVQLAGATSGHYATSLAVYLQGLLIAQRDYYCEGGSPLNVVHLDSRTFIARLPDRRELVDSAEQMKRVTQAIERLWGRLLREHKKALTPDLFCERFWPVAQHTANHALFDDVPLLPRQACDQVVSYPINGGTTEFCESLAQHLDRQAVESGEVGVVAMYTFDDDEVARWMYVRARGLVLVNAASLGDGHWVHAHLRDIASGDIAVTAVEPSHRVEFDGRWVCPTVQLCRRVTIRVGNDQVDVDDDAVFHDAVVYLPAGCHSGEVVRQISDYQDEYDRFDDADCHADAIALADLVRRLRAVDPKATLMSLMRDLRLERYPLLVGKAFRLQVAATDDGHTVEVVD